VEILLLEDDPVMADILNDYLSEFYNVDQVFDANAAFAKGGEKHYDLFLFDINVPGKNGITLLRELRDFAITTPAILLTAYEDTGHLTDGFNAGAHDYIKKPFALEELRARIENTKRLFHIEQHAPCMLDERHRYYPDRRLVEHDGLQQILSPKEAAILEYFLAHRNRTVTTAELMQNLWDYDRLPSDATLRSHIRRLRELIGPERIVTVRSLGYRYE